MKHYIVPYHLVQKKHYSRRRTDNIKWKMLVHRELNSKSSQNRILSIKFVKSYSFYIDYFISSNNLNWKRSMTASFPGSLSVFVQLKEMWKLKKKLEPETSRSGSLRSNLWHIASFFKSSF